MKTATQLPMKPRANQIMTRKEILVAVLCVLVVAILCVGVVHVTHSEAPRQMHLFLTPHPDDELQGLTALSTDNSTYMLIVTATSGEATGNCRVAGPPGLQGDLGEYPPPVPQALAHTPECGGNRIHSWNQFWNRVAARYPSLALDLEATHETVNVDGRPVDTWLGKNSGRIALNLGDGTLTSEKVVAGVEKILTWRGSKLPDLPLVAVTAAGYYNDPEVDPKHSSEAALLYKHHDHLAVTNAGIKLADKAKNGAWIVVNPFDPRANEKRVLSIDEYEDYMGLQHNGSSWQGWHDEFQGVEIQPGDKPRKYPQFSWIDTEFREGISKHSVLFPAKRLGAYQQFYGWLAFPDPWIPGEYQLAHSDVLFARQQFFLHTLTARGVSLAPETVLKQG
ncbi:hypothetical protein F4555_001130 [Mobiluncus mulieris]|uniref:hypothetical protein n=1 Tax=Mobiluncus mulieris TaxID=2052 RepID=UPI0017D96DBF|nr:hypothetical protein [Mobiluncus mulieris]MBB5846334.1 hypothetical protein [Mobiluncus mulieris]